MVPNRYNHEPVTHPTFLWQCLCLFVWFVFTERRKIAPLYYPGFGVMDRVFKVNTLDWQIQVRNQSVRVLVRVHLRAGSSVYSLGYFQENWF